MKEHKLPRSKIDWYLRFAWLLVLISIITIATYYIIVNVQSCTSQPLKFAVEKVKERFDVDIVYGRLTIQKGAIREFIDFGDSVNNSYDNLFLK